MIANSDEAISLVIALAAAVLVSALARRAQDRANEARARTREAERAQEQLGRLGDELRARHRDIGVLVLSQYYEESYALELIGDNAEGVGYLLKERVGDVDAFTEAVARVAAGGSALDPEVVGRMLGRRGRDDPVERLSPRERDVLGALAQGKSNQGIAQALFVTDAAVEKHVTSIFQKLGLDPGPTEHRRVLAALAYLRSSDRAPR